MDKNYNKQQRHVLANRPAVVSGKQAADVRTNDMVGFCLGLFLTAK